MIIDEAHHLHKSHTLYDCVCQLSEAARGVLILTATPIQRHAEEYLALHRHLGFSRADILRLIEQGIETSWLPERQKRGLLSEFQSVFATLEAGQASEG